MASSIFWHTWSYCRPALWIGAASSVSRASITAISAASMCSTARPLFGGERALPRIGTDHAAGGIRVRLAGGCELPSMGTSDGERRLRAGEILWGRERPAVLGAVVVNVETPREVFHALRCYAGSDAYAEVLRRCGAGSMPVSLDDRPHGGGRDRIAQADEFTADPAVAPGLVIASHLDHQDAQPRSGSRTAGPATGIGPAAFDQPAVPAQHRPRRNDQPYPIAVGRRQQPD